MRNMGQRTLLIFVLVAGLGCGDDGTSPGTDAGRHDAGGGDAGGGIDAGRDAGMPEVDAGMTDAGMSDAGCMSTTDCPAPVSRCEVAFCGGGTCMTMPMAVGTRVGAQTDGDCMVHQCDGAGGGEDAADNTDIGDDGNDCTTDSCMDGSP